MLFCTFLYHHYTTTTSKSLFSRFVEDAREHKTLTCFFLNFDTAFWNATPEKTANIWRIELEAISATNFEKAQLHK